MSVIDNLKVTPLNVYFRLNNGEQKNGIDCKLKETEFIATENSLISGFALSSDGRIWNYEDIQSQQLQIWLTKHHIRGTNLALAIPADFVLSRGLLSRIIKTFSPDKYYAEGLLFYATKYKGLTFLKEEKSDAKQEAQKNMPQHLQWCIYAGIKFEEYARETEGNYTLNYGIYIAQLEKLRFFYTAEIDGTQENELIELKTKSIKVYQFGKDMDYEIFKWLLQCHLSGITKILLGIHEDFLIKKIASLNIKKEAAKYPVIEQWIEKCLRTTNKLFLDMNHYLDTQPEGTVLKFNRYGETNDGSKGFDINFLKPGNKMYEKIITPIFMSHEWT